MYNLEEAPKHNPFLLLLRCIGNVLLLVSCFFLEILVLFLSCSCIVVFWCPHGLLILYWGKIMVKCTYGECLKVFQYSDVQYCP